MNIDILKSADIDYDSGVERFSGLDAGCSTGYQLSLTEK